MYLKSYNKHFLMLYWHPKTARYPRALHRFLAGPTLPECSQAESPQVTSEGPSQTYPDPHAWTHFPVSRTPSDPQKGGEGRVGRKSGFRRTINYKIQQHWHPLKPLNAVSYTQGVRPSVPFTPSLCSSGPPAFSAATLWPSWPLGLPTACSLTLSRPHLANAPILLGRAGLSRAAGELGQIWGRTHDRLWGRGGDRCRHRTKTLLFIRTPSAPDREVSHAQTPAGGRGIQRGVQEPRVGRPKARERGRDPGSGRAPGSREASLLSPESVFPLWLSGGRLQVESMRLAEAAVRGTPNFLRVQRGARWLYQRIPQWRGAPREGPCGVSDEQKESLACLFVESSGPVPKDIRLCRELQGLRSHKLTEGGGKRPKTFHRAVFRDRLVPVSPAEQRKVSAGTVTTPPHTREGRTVFK